MRRYNATSARTLAVFLASQDNPEQGLCRNTYVERSGPSLHISKSKKAAIGETKVVGKSQEGSTMHGDDGMLPKSIIAHRSNSTRSMDNGKVDNRKSARTSEEIDDLIRSRVQVLDEPTKMDHKSFVQNVFGTVAFKMVEWLTPSNLQRLSSPDKSTPASQPTKSRLSQDSPKTAEGIQHNDPEVHTEKENMENMEKKDGLECESEAPLEKENRSIEPSKNEPTKTQHTPSKIKSKPRVGNGQPLESFPKSPSAGNPTPKRKNSHVRTSSESLEQHKPKSILNLPQKPPEMDPGHFAQIKSPRQKVVRQAVLTSPSIRVAESPSPTEIQSKSPIMATETIPKPAMVEYSHSSDENTNDDLESKRDQRNHQHKNTKSKPLRTQRSLPQSLSSLSVEVIQMLCQVMQSTGTTENHTLHPQAITKELISKLTIDGAISPEPVEYWISLGLESQSVKIRWQRFIEQSLFDVLSHPATLIQSFRQRDRFLDTQTIWYLMLRLTRVAPSLLFDSLWRASKSLFETPELLENSYDWPHKRPGKTSEPLSNDDAAQVISLCLHALVASMPLVCDARKLANMSRIRSYGLSTLGRDSTSLEPVALCLQYDDAFTNEHAMRLARRLFAAIPTRRAFAELVEFRKDVKDTNVPRPDILDAVLASLKLDPELIPDPLPTTNSHLKFSHEENELHEHRMYVLVLDWARTVMLQEWQGSAVVPRDGPFGGALMTMAAMCKTSYLSH